MNILSLVDNMSVEMYERLKHAAETGKWPEGVKVDQAQRDSALQLSMAYQSRKLNSDEILTVGADGEMVNKSKSELRTQFSQDNVSVNSSPESDVDAIARFKNL